jgi:hypothetical protein
MSAKLFLRQAQALNKLLLFGIHSLGQNLKIQRGLNTNTKKLRSNFNGDLGTGDEVQKNTGNFFDPRGGRKVAGWL